jgi:hypothetical protein
VVCLAWSVLSGPGLGAEENPGNQPALAEQEAGLLWEKVDRLNHELEEYAGSVPQAELDGLLQAAVELIQYRNLGQEFDRLNEKAYLAENYFPINAGIKRAAPAIAVISGASGFRLGINLPYFTSKVGPQSTAFRFFKLAQQGWNDGFTDHGGGNEWPAWVEVAEDLDGKDIPPVKTRLLAEWKTLQPQLSGVFRQLADATIKRLEAKGK